MSREAKLCWLLLILSIIRQYSNHSWNVPDAVFFTHQTLNNFWYFFCTDIMWLTVAVFCARGSGAIICGLLVGLAIGKIIDEFFNPYGYHVPEKIWDSLVALFGIMRYMKKRNNEQSNT